MTDKRIVDKVSTLYVNNNVSDIYDTSLHINIIISLYGIRYRKFMRANSEGMALAERVRPWHVHGVANRRIEVWFGWSRV